MLLDFQTGQGQDWSPNEDRKGWGRKTEAQLLSLGSPVAVLVKGQASPEGML